MSTLQHWSHALLDPTLGAPTGLTTWNHSDTEKRLAVYRNNVMVSLVDALAQTFPVTLQLVGEPFFRAMAQVFVRAHPPRTRVLARYGEELVGFIKGFPPAAGLPYLSEVAQLEWLRLQALHAADAPPLDREAIAIFLQDSNALPTLHWQLAPDVQLLQSSHAVVSLWAAHQPEGGVAFDDVDVTQPESALIFRSGLDVMVMQIDPGLAALVGALQVRTAFGEAIEQASGAAPGFDLSEALAVLIRHEMLIGAQRLH
ncbi:MAG: DUF2063 domain-containing protein [Betaproteobacteria bacterium HGW-Betaproteobacteria-16]|nr:MAG: DUF2063 domain-containing protein [Betaproteobacteria bacterium HGW-Betaproteobacteria-16]